MPELPEVETVRRGLAVESAGKRITEVLIDGHRSVRRHPPAHLVENVLGRTVQKLRRKGKFLLVDLDDVTLALHLRMSGQLLWSSSPDLPLKKHTHVRLRFDTGEELRFVDPRTFGEFWITSFDTPELGHLGPDAFEELESPEQLRTRIARRTSSIKTVLLNQEVIAGIGNIYADEILFAAGIRPTRAASAISRPGSVKLHDAIRQVLGNAVEARGSSLADEQYVDLYGRAGEAQLAHRVHARAGFPCPTCGHSIERVKIGGRSSYFCRECQR